METQTKVCQKCKIKKTLDQFGKDNSRRDGLRYTCKLCDKARRAAYYLNVQKAVMQENYDPAEAREKRFQREYGISVGKYYEMYNQQNGCCAICLEPFELLAVDHDHDTGKVRGLLCRGCNTALGGLKDSVENLRRAIAYLERNDFSG